MDFTGIATPGLQYLGQAPVGAKYGYLTHGPTPFGFALERRGFFYSELQFTTLVGTREPVFLDGRSFFRAGMVLHAPELPPDSFLFYFCNWKVGGMPWTLTVF